MQYKIFLTFLFGSAIPNDTISSKIRGWIINLVFNGKEEEGFAAASLIFSDSYQRKENIINYVMIVTI